MPTHHEVIRPPAGLEKIVALAAFVFASSSAPVLAQTPAAPPAIATKMLMQDPLGDTDGPQISLYILTVRAGVTIPSHSHKGAVFAYILEGNIENQVEPVPRGWLLPRKPNAGPPAPPEPEQNGNREAAHLSERRLAFQRQTAGTGAAGKRRQSTGERNLARCGPCGNLHRASTPRPGVRLCPERRGGKSGRSRPAQGLPRGRCLL